MVILCKICNKYVFGGESITWQQTEYGLQFLQLFLDSFSSLGPCQIQSDQASCIVSQPFQGYFLGNGHNLSIISVEMVNKPISSKWFAC